MSGEVFVILQLDYNESGAVNQGFSGEFIGTTMLTRLFPPALTINLFSEDDTFN